MELLNLAIQWPGGFDFHFVRKVRCAVGAILEALGAVMRGIHLGKNVIRGPAQR